MKKIFIRYTILGDQLNPNEIAKEIPLEAQIFQKNEIVPFKHPLSIQPKPQKTNRWTYRWESTQKETVNQLIARMYKHLSPHLASIQKYAQKHRALIDITIFEELPGAKWSVNISLSKKSIQIINLLMASLHIDYIDG